MATENVISTEKMDEILNDYFPETQTMDFHGQELIVRTTVTPQEMFALVKQIASGCFGPDGGYQPEVLDISLRAGVIDFYTNVSLPKDIERMSRVLYGTDLYDAVLEHIDHGQWSAIVDAVWERVNARNDANRVLFESEIQQAVGMIQNLGDQISQVFSGLTQEDIQSLVAAIGAGGIDEEKLVQAVVTEQNKQREEKPSLEVIEGGKADDADGE